MTEEFRWDADRRERIGLEEAIFCAGKSSGQIRVILDAAADADRGLLLTRLDEQRFAALDPAHKAKTDFDPVSKTAFFNAGPARVSPPSVAVLAAGSSDVPVAAEACRTLDYMSVGYETWFDVGVAGLWRLTSRIDEISKLPVLIVAAGMDAALASVLGGLVPGLVIAVPTSVGYGVADGGRTALNAMLVSCAPGILVCNIDNGYGAACAAKRALGVRDRDR